MSSSGFHVKVRLPISPSFVVNTNSYTPTTISKNNTSALNGTSSHVVYSMAATAASTFDKDMDSTTLLPPLKAPKSYGTYTKQQQEEVIAFIKDGNSLRTAEKIFGIPKSTMHCWLKKLQLETECPPPTMTDVVQIDVPEEKPSPKPKRPSNPQPLPTEKPRTQIVIEEVELIRFLRTDEGAELISKAYHVSLNDFRNFIKQAKQTRLKGADSQNSPNSTSRSQSCSSQQPSTTDRKRNGDAMRPSYYVSGILDKRPKLETNTCINRNSGVSDLVTLLTNNSDKNHILNDRSKKLVLTKEQLVTASKLIKNAHGVNGVVSTYIVTKPLVVSNQLTIPTNSLPLNLNRPMKESPKSDISELSPTYPKIISPVSIKAERSEMDYMMTSCSEYSTSPLVVPRLQQNGQNHFMTTISSNTSAAMNLNEINRTQSEKELMALVDGDDGISADELCTDFGKSLDVSSWIDNETWYMDQYFQHFQVSPTSNSPVKSSSSDFVLSSSVSSIDDDSSTAGITFTSGDDKEKIVRYIQEGHSIEDAERSFNVTQTKITPWVDERGLDCDDYETKPDISALNQSRNARFESAFYRPNNKTIGSKQYTCQKSAFSRAASS